MSERVYGNNYWTTMVYVDSYKNNVLKGWFQNPYLKSPQKFDSLSDFIIKMESMMDVMGLPQSFSASRSFKKLNPVRTPEAREAFLKQGDKASFCLTIRFRQNSSWQGTIKWIDSRSTQNFRSVLELIVLMDSALREQSFTEETKERAAMA